MCGAKTRSIPKADKGEMETFKVLRWRKGLKKTTNRNNKDGCGFRRMKSMWDSLKLRRKAWIGYQIRNSPWITTVIEGNPERGKLRTPSEQVMENTGITTYEGFKRIINDRGKRRETSIII